MIKILHTLPEPEKSAILSRLQNDGLSSSFGEYIRFSFEELQDVNSTIMCYSGNDAVSVDSFLNQLNGAESDYLRLINQASHDKAQLKQIQLKVRNANKRCRLHVIAIQEKLNDKSQDNLTVMNKLKNIFK